MFSIDGVIREVVERARGGVFAPPGNAPALAEAIAALERDRAKAKAMGAAARAYVVAHFDRAKHANEFVDLLTALVEPRKEKPPPRSAPRAQREERHFRQDQQD